jgi:hypothetical protein
MRLRVLTMPTGRGLLILDELGDIEPEDGAQLAKTMREAVPDADVVVFFPGSLDVPQVAAPQEQPFIAEPAVICEVCDHQAFMHPDEEQSDPAPSCIGAGPGYNCSCPRTCQRINRAGR